MAVPNKHTEEIVLSTHDVDLTERWTLGGIMRAMQLASDRHATLLGVGKDHILPQGLYWVIARMRIDMRSYPRYGDAVTVETWPGTPERVAFPRYFKFEDKDGVVGTASILYMLLSTETHRFVPPAKTAVYPRDMQIHPDANPMPDKIRFTEANRGTVYRKPSYSDIDLNRHMNNTRYGQWICDLFPTSKFESQVIKTCQINFIADGVEGHLIALNLHEEDNSFAVQGTDTDNGGKTVFECFGEWMEA